MNGTLWSVQVLKLDSILPAMNATLAGLQDKVPSGLSQPTVGSVMGWTAITLLVMAVYEQLKFQVNRRKGATPLPGPAYTVPFLGGIVEMVMDPHAFWEKQRAYSFPGLSWNSIVGWYTVLVSDPPLIRHVFNHNSADSLLLELHPNARMVLGNKNIAFMHGPRHKQLRKSFLALFTRKALSVYIAKQDRVVRQHLAAWMENPGPREFRNEVRDMNAYTSQEVFVGPYLDDPKVRQRFSDAYRAMTEAFLAFPLKFPGTAVWKGYKGRLFILEVLEAAAVRSKAKMAAGEEPECLLDFWTQEILREVQDADAAGTPHPYYATNDEMAYVVMDFLFASQDASTASLVWEMTQMAEHPEILARVREEQLRLRPDLNATITGDVLYEMHYTRQVVKEVLRFRPPAPMVPQMAQRPFKISDQYTAPKGTLIIPDIVSACRQGYSNPNSFDPDRFSPERKEDVTYASNFLVFGHGPHYCVGKEYAINHLAVFLALLATTLDWERVRSAKSDHILYLPTIYPADSVFKLSWRVGGQQAVAAAAAL